LLEFALEQLPSFGVGRISSLYMYPMTFKEFIVAIAGAGSAALLKIPGKGIAVDPVFHAKFLDLFRSYSIVGGMPAVVKLYKEKNDLSKCRSALDELLATFKDDFAKYKTRISQLKLFETLKSAALQAGCKFTYARIADTGPQTAYKQALDLLEMAGLIHKVYHTSGTGIPLGAQINAKKFKVIPLDLGLHQRLLGLELSELLTDPMVEFINKGSIAEIFAGLELCGTEKRVQAMPKSIICCKKARILFLSRSSPVNGDPCKACPFSCPNTKADMESVSRSKIAHGIRTLQSYRSILPAVLFLFLTVPYEYGFTASICKPFRKSELSAMLNKYLQPKPTRCRNEIK
jgi:hypothetical protein